MLSVQEAIFTAKEERLYFQQRESGNGIASLVPC